MTQVCLTDDTIYNIDTDSKHNATSVVEYKLRQRLDRRCIKSSTVISGAMMDPEHKHYNSGDQFDGIPLKCCSGWSYKWGTGTDYKCSEFR